MNIFEIFSLVIKWTSEHPHTIPRYFHLRSHLKPSSWKIYNERGLNEKYTEDFYAREISILMENFRHEDKL